MTPAQRLALIRSLIGHGVDPERVLDDIAAVLAGATLTELAERRAS